MSQKIDDFTELLTELLDRSIPFAVFGAQAVIAHGVSSRRTGDLDVYIQPSPQVAPSVLKLLRAIHYPPHIVGADLEVFSSPGAGVWMGFEPRRIDLHTEVLGLPDPLADTVELEVHGVLVPTLSVSALIASKLASARPKDLGDVRALRTL